LERNRKAGQNPSRVVAPTEEEEEEEEFLKPIYHRYSNLQSSVQIVVYL